MQEHWSGWPFPSPGDLPDPGIKHVCLALAGKFLTSGETLLYYIANTICAEYMGSELRSGRDPVHTNLDGFPHSPPNSDLFFLL